MDRKDFSKETEPKAGKMQKGIYLKTGIEVFVHGENGTFIDEKDDYKVKNMIMVSKQYPSRYVFSVRETELLEML